MSRKLQSRPQSRCQSRVATDHPSLPVSMELVLDNHDLLFQILLFLPAKSLIRFKSVCKKWLSLISSDQLCHQHTLRRPKLQQSIIIQMHTQHLFYLNSEMVMIPYSLGVGESKILQACHGLLLLECENSYYIYNPTTRQSRKISLTNMDNFPYVAAITLAFDPSKSPYYKVVCIRSPPKSNPLSNCNHYRIEVYDSESHTWKLGVEECKCEEIYNDGLYWNNRIFCSTIMGDHFCFDIAKNEERIIFFGPLGNQPYDFYAETCKYLMESNGHLYLFLLLKSDRHASKEGGVWKFVEYDKDYFHDYLGAIHEHSVMDTSGLFLMVRSGGDGYTCSAITYEAERRRIMAYNYLDEGSELLVDLTGQPVSKFDQVIKAFQFGEILALV